MRDDSRIIVVDGALPQRGMLPNPIERMLTSLDLQMMDRLNAKERTKGDWIRLFKQTDERLEARVFVQPEGSADTVMEVVLHGEMDCI